MSKKVKKVLVVTFILSIMILYFIGSNEVVLADTLKKVGEGFNYSFVPNTPISNNVKAPFEKIWGSLMLIFQIASVGGVAFVGVKYMLSSSETKADIKSSMIRVIIGMTIVFAASTIVKIIVNVFDDIT